SRLFLWSHDRRGTIVGRGGRVWRERRALVFHPCRCGARSWPPPAGDLRPPRPPPGQRKKESVWFWKWGTARSARRVPKPARRQSRCQRRFSGAKALAEQAERQAD